MDEPENRCRPLQGRHILVVEDEPLLAFEYQDELESKGASAIVAMTLAEGLSAMSEQHVDLAILDLNLGRDLSWPLAQNLTAKGVPFFIVSGRCLPADSRGRHFCRIARIAHRPAAHGVAPLNVIRAPPDPRR